METVADRVDLLHGTIVTLMMYEQVQTVCLMMLTAVSMIMLGLAVTRKG